MSALVDVQGRTAAEQKLLAGCAARIEKHRMASLTVTVRDAQGRPVPGIKVRVPSQERLRLEVRLRHPDHVPIRSVTVRGAAGATVSGEVVTVPCRGGSIELTARY